MRSNAARSIALALLMIVSVQLPMFDAEPERLELDDTSLKEKAPPSPCQGYDACRGTDAGQGSSAAINLTSDFDWTGANETNVYYGQSEGTSTSSTAANNYDMYLVDPPMGYGVLFELEWNHSTPGSYNYADSYAYRMSIGPGDGNMVGYSYSTSATYGGAWAYCYYSNTGSIAMSTTNYNENSGTPPYCYSAPTGNTYYPHAVAFPHDLAGSPVMASIMSYQAYQLSYDDYKLTVTVYPGDAGGIGDETSAISGPNQPWNSGQTQHWSRMVVQLHRHVHPRSRGLAGYRLHVRLLVRIRDRYVRIRTRRGLIQLPNRDLRPILDRHPWTLQRSGDMDSNHD